MGFCNSSYSGEWHQGFKWLLGVSLWVISALPINLNTLWVWLFCFHSPPAACTELGNEAVKLFWEFPPTPPAAALKLARDRELQSFEGGTSMVASRLHSQAWHMWCRSRSTVGGRGGHYVLLSSILKSAGEAVYTYPSKPQILSSVIQILITHQSNISTGTFMLSPMLPSMPEWGFLQKSLKPFHFAFTLPLL